MVCLFAVVLLFDSEPRLRFGDILQSFEDAVSALEGSRNSTEAQAGTFRVLLQRVGRDHGVLIPAGGIRESQSHGQSIS